MALTLHERGVFTWTEWAATLADEIKRAQAAGDPDTGETYYRHWLATLERLVAEKGVTTADDAAPLPRRLGPRRRPHAARPADRAEAGGFWVVSSSGRRQYGLVRQHQTWKLEIPGSLLRIAPE